MGTEENLSLQRLLRPKQAAALLESVAPLAPGVAFALLRADRKALASTGSWPERMLEGKWRLVPVVSPELFDMRAQS